MEVPPRVDMLLPGVQPGGNPDLLRAVRKGVSVVIHHNITFYMLFNLKKYNRVGNVGNIAWAMESFLTKFSFSTYLRC